MPGADSSAYAATTDVTRATSSVSNDIHLRRLGVCPRWCDPVPEKNVCVLRAGPGRRNPSVCRGFGVS